MPTHSVLSRSDRNVNRHGDVYLCPSAWPAPYHELRTYVLGTVSHPAKALVRIPHFLNLVGIDPAAVVSNGQAQKVAQVLITSWNGSDPSNPPYPYEMGAVSLLTDFSHNYGSAISVPFQLGYLNNGDLSPCDPLTLEPKVWTIGDGTHIGDTFTQHGTTTCPYFTGDWGTYANNNNRLDGFSVDATYVVEQGPRTCPRFKPCYYPHITVLTGGTGTITDTIINH